MPRYKSKEKTQAYKGARFTVGTAVIGAATYVMLSLVMHRLEQITSASASVILSMFGTALSNGTLVVFNDLAVRVIPLCVGDIEIAVLTGAILSTEDRTINDRLLGVSAAFVFVMLINAVRIAGTMLAWQAFGTQAIEFIHSLLFRATLVIAIIGFYACWYLRDDIKLKLHRLLSEN